MNNSQDLRLAVDIGGTFTDAALITGAGQIFTAKALTTHQRPVDAALSGARTALAAAGSDLADVTGMIHGTTLATNALIERRGARVACILTDGFRDILEIAYERRYEQYDINIRKPDLLVPRSRCFTVPERVGPDGQILTPLDETAFPALLAQIDGAGAQAVAICLLHAYAHPGHEQRLATWLRAARPGLSVSLSSEVSPEAREFDRLCTTVANAYIQPLISQYLSDFAAALADAGLTCPILMMTAGGGMTTLQVAARLPVRLVESGPAGGAILAARVARQLDLADVLSFDMGGTTAKLCLIDNARPQTARRFEIARAERFTKGSGMPVRIPVIEMIEIGAGGGSIASVDGIGRLSVGPESAGSEPGPAAFGRGGLRPTVTDADVALGLIAPEGFAEGRLKIDKDAAADALSREIGKPLSLNTAQAAEGVAEIVDENMAGAARVHAVESGKDLGTRTMIAFGGNGPLHATRIAARTGVRRIVIPPDPSVGSAMGFLYAPVSFEIVRSLYAELDGMDTNAVSALLAAMSDEATATVRLAATAAVSTRRTAFMRYKGQGHEIEVALPDTLEPSDLPDLKAAFEAEYTRQFSRPVPGMTIEILNWSVVTSTAAIDPKGAPVTRQNSPNRPVAEPTTRRIHCDVTSRPIDAAVYDRTALDPATTVSGPALIVEPQTTTLVSDGWTARCDDAGNIVMEAT